MQPLANGQHLRLMTYLSKQQNNTIDTIFQQWKQKSAMILAFLNYPKTPQIFKGF